MNRPIKFRGLDVNGNWYYGYLSVITEGRIDVPRGSYISNKVGSPFAYQVRPETVGQYTGLQDRNGKEIYEGDLVEHDGEDNGVWVRYQACEIAFDEDYSMFCFKDDAPNNLADFYQNLEVIGNIYEHSHLLEQPI